jgi:hypothetical protein
MEPITVIIMNFDLLVSYYFFILRNRSWSLEGIHGSIIDRNKNVILKRYGINIDRYEELKQIRSHLDFRLGLLSKNPHILLETLEKPMRLLDTR